MAACAFGIACALGLGLGTVSPPAAAITLTRTGDTIHLAGRIEVGDAKVFEAFVTEQKRAANVEPDYDRLGGVTVTFDSPGGSLSDGIEIGQIIHKNWLETRVTRGKACLSACAVAFLGGVRQYATGIGPWREIERGARLGYHGYASSGTDIVILDQAFDQARALNAFVLSYAFDMTRIDLGFLSELFNVPASSMRDMRSPADLRKLGIVLLDPPKPPPDAGYNVCRTVVRKTVPSLDGWSDDDRLSRQRHLIRTPADLAKGLIDHTYEPGFAADKRTRDLLLKLPPAEVIGLLSGRQISPDGIRYPVERYETGRGAGFYYDHCYVLFDPEGTAAQSVLVSITGPAAYANHGPLDLFPPDAPLWE